MLDGTGELRAEIREIVQLCLEQGVLEAEPRTMVIDNPARLLVLD